MKAFIDTYIYLISPFCGWLLAQFLKPFAHYCVEGKWESKRWRMSSGMPSSHSSTMSALATIIGYLDGIQSQGFAIAFVLALIVMYDAKGVRNASGKHAAYLNTIMDDINEFFRNGLSSERFKTELGHNSLQVVAGMLLGILVGLGFGFLSTHL